MRYTIRAADGVANETETKMNSLSDIFPASDDLASAINAQVDTTRRDLPRQPIVRALRDELPTAEGVGQYVEACPKCAGRGRFVSWAGRDCGQCFTCHGKGKLFFKSSAATRAARRDAAEARRERVQAEALETFKAAHPDVFAWFDGSTFPLAISFREAVQKWGSLTEKQLAAARSCIAKRDAAKAAAVARVENAPAVETSALETAFATAAQNGLKFPKVRFAGLTVSPAPATGKNAGSLYVKADGEYCGKITSGRFICTRECDDATKARVIDTLKDPKSAAIAYGIETGSCSCCGRELTDPASVSAGIGPICAKKFGW